MKAYIFQLEAPASSALRGIVVVFATAPQEVWHRLDGDSEALEIPHTVANNETVQFGEELAGLTPGQLISGGARSLIGQISEDAAVVGDHRLRFAGRRKFQVVVRSTTSFRSWVEHWFKEEQDRSNATSSPPV